MIPARPDPTGWRREAPLLVGVLVGCAFLLHPAWPRFVQPLGADWETYLGSAGHLFLDPAAFDYNEWRPPLYPLLVGLVGALGSYVTAGQALALLSSLLLVAATGWLGRSLAGPWAGGLAAFTAAGLPVVVDGSFWVTPYPLAGAATAVALAAATATVPAARPGLAGAAGLAAGFAWALDARGAGVALAVLGLAVLGPGPRARRALALGLALAGMLAMVGVDRACRARWDLEILPLRRQVELQHGLPRGPGGPKGQATVSELPSCQGQPDPRLTLARLVDDCARDRRAENVRSLRKREEIPPPAWLLGLLPLALLPGRRGWRGSAASALALGPAAAATWLSLSWVPFVDRYLLPWAACLACLGPVALVRAGDTLGRPAARRIALALAALWSVVAWPGIRPWHVWNPMDHLEGRKAEIPQAGEVREVLARDAAALPPDDLLLDCAGMHVQARLLPARPPVIQAPPHHPDCWRFARHPPAGAGHRWLLTRHRAREPGDPKTVDPDLLLSLGWEEVPIDDDVAPGSYAERLAAEVRRWRRPGEVAGDGA